MKKQKCICVWKRRSRKKCTKSLTGVITLDMGIKDYFYLIFYKKYVLCFNSVVLN